LLDLVAKLAPALSAASLASANNFSAEAS